MKTPSNIQLLPLEIWDFFKCECMPFGLYNVPATFQRLMQSCLGELNLTCCLIYLDDVIVYAKDEEEHLDRLRSVFGRFRRDSLKLKPSKCNLFQKEITYLAHDVSAEESNPPKLVSKLWLNSLSQQLIPRLELSWV